MKYIKQIHYIMSIEKKFSPLVNQFSGSVKIRQIVGLPEPEPTVCYGYQDLFRNKKSQDMYIEKLYSMMRTRTVDSRFNLFDNNTASAHWVKLHLEENERSINLFPEKITKHIKKIKLFAEEHNIDISDNLTNIDLILEEYNNDPKITDIKNHLQKKKDAVNTWDLAIQECVHVMKKTAKELDPNMRNYDFIKYDNNIDTNEDLAVMKKFIDEESGIFENNRTSKEPNLFDYSIIENYVDRLNKENIEAFIKLRDAGIPLKLADTFMMEKQSKPVAKDITSFLNEKITEKTLEEQGIKNVMEFNNSKIKEIILFSDKSMVMKKSDNTYADVFTSKQLHTLKDTIVAEHIRNTFKKNPTVAKNFIDIFKRENSLINLGKLLVAVNTYSTNLDFFNNKPFDIKAEYEKSELVKQDKYRAVEDLDDKMNKKIKDHKVQLFAHSIASNKYMNLYNDESYKIIESIYDLNLKTTIFQDYIGKKIAAYKTPEQFNEGLSGFLKSFNGFDMQSMLVKAENAGARIISEADDTLIIEIEDYQQSKLLGSSSWCIVRDESYFNSYTEDGNKQYFLYDFSLDSADNASMIGFTLDRNGDHYAAHYKDDEEVNQDEETLSYAHDIINELNYKETVNRTARMSIPNA
jgi:hypothetical protein